MSNTNGLDIRDNLIIQGLSLPEKDALVYSRNPGYNKMQQLTNFFTQQAGGAIAKQQKRFDTYSVGSTSISAKVANNSTTTGNLLNVTVVSGENNGNYRVDDTVVDDNFTQGVIVNVISDTQFQLALADDSITSWNTSTHFTQNMYAGVTANAQLSRNTGSRKPLYVTPTGDYNYIQTLRESGLQFIDDSIQSFVKVDGKMWYSTNHMSTVERLSHQIENWYFSSARSGTSVGTPNERLTSGTIRWSIINQGGTYNPIGNVLTRNDLHDTLNAFARKSANRGTELYAFCGQEAMSNLQDLTTNPIIYSGNTNTFGGMSVEGWNVMEYASAGVKLKYVHWPLLDDPNLMGNVISSITGKPRWSSTILAFDASTVPSYAGEANVPPIQKVYFKGAGEYVTTFLPGMMDMNQALGNARGSITPQAGMSLSVSALDGMAFEMLATLGLRILAERFFLIELTN